MTMTVDDFASVTDVSRETLDRLQVYADLLVKWQKSYNLVGPSTLPDLWRRHMLDSAQLVPLILSDRPNDADLSWLDFGAGAGFPGLVMAIMGLGHAHMVESNGKKCAFMREVIRNTGAKATVHQVRIEDTPPLKVDFITSRALAPVLDLLNWSEKFMAEDVDFWLLKGKGADQELTEAQLCWNMTVERHQSQTDNDGVCLHLRGVSRVRAR